MKFLTDAQTNAKFVEMLRRLRWDVDTVYDHGIDGEKDDARLVGWAHANGMVFVSYDRFKGEQGVKVARQIRDWGGRVIEIHGGPQQAPERALGKVLFHYPEWHPFLDRHEGKVQIGDIRPQSCRLLPRSKMQAELKSLERVPFDPYLERREAARRGPIKRRRRKPVDLAQSHLDMP